jgi:triphosphoribosyl-dephospho-CoA synthase
VRPARRAQLALLLEVAGTPKPGNVDRRRDHEDLRFEHFLGGAVGATAGLEAAEAGEPVGQSFERAVAGMASAQSGGNTQFGALLLLVPLVRAASDGELSRERARAVVESTTVADAVAFCRAFEHVAVAVGDPPEALADLDVRHPESAAAAVERRGLTLSELLGESAAVDGVAREWSTGFERSFEAAERLLERPGPLPDRAADVYLELLAEEPDPFVAKRHGAGTAERTSRGARAVLAGERDVEELAESLADEGVNPGTTADIVAAGLFIALERGVSV